MATSNVSLSLRPIIWASLDNDGEELLKPSLRPTKQPFGISVNFGGTMGFGQPEDPREEFVRSTILNQSGLVPSYYVDMRIEHQGHIWGLLPSSTDLKWYLAMKYKENLDYNRTLNSEYGFDISNPYFEVWGDIGHTGINFLGMQLLEGEFAVPNNDYLSPANRDIRELLYSDLYVGIPIKNAYVPFIGLDAWAGEFNDFRTSEAYRFFGMAQIVGGLKVDTHGYTGQIKIGWGTYGEQRVLLTEGRTVFSNPAQALRESEYRPVMSGEIDFRTPRIGPASYSVFGDYESIGEGDLPLTQWSAGLGADFGKWGNYGVEYYENPVSYVGENSRYTLNAMYTFNAAGSSKLYMPVRVGPSYSSVTMPDGSSGSIIMIKFDATLGLAGKKDLFGSRTAVERFPRGGPQ